MPIKLLNQLQEDFLAAVQDEKNSHFLHAIQNTINLSAQECLAIYCDSIQEGFLVALKEAYPVCEKLVGDKFFRAMAKKYIQQTPSNSPDLGEYGESFATFIANFPPAQTVIYLADVARLEWAWSKVHHGPAEAKFDFTALEKIPEEQQGKIQFQLLDNSVLLTSPYPIHRIWEIHQENFTGDFHVDFNNKETRLFVWRDDLQTVISPLSNIEYKLLGCIKNGYEISILNEESLKILPEIFKRGWISSFKIKNSV